MGGGDEEEEQVEKRRETDGWVEGDGSRLAWGKERGKVCTGQKTAPTVQGQVKRSAEGGYICIGQSIALEHERVVNNRHHLSRRRRYHAQPGTVMARGRER